MPRDKKVDDWIDEHGIAKPTQQLLNVGCIVERTKEHGALIGLLVRYQDEIGHPEQTLRFRLRPETARQVSELLQSYLDLAENHTPDLTPTKPN